MFVELKIWLSLCEFVEFMQVLSVSRLYMMD